MIPSAWSGAHPPTRNQFVGKIASTFGYEAGNDEDLALKALDWLDEVVVDLNMNTWECTRVMDQNIPLVLDQQYIVLDQDAFKSSQAYMVHDTDGDLPPMTNMPWVKFKRLYFQTEATGLPCVYSLFNQERDGRLYFDVKPTQDEVDNYTLTVEYYTRIPKFSQLGGGESPNIPAEFESAILNGALKRAALHFGDPRSGEFASLEAAAIERLKRIDSYQPDADRRFKLIDEAAYEPNVSNLIYPF